MDHDQLVAQLSSVTGADPDTCKFHLEAAGWNIEVPFVLVAIKIIIHLHVYVDGDSELLRHARLACGRGRGCGGWRGTP